MFGWKRIFFSFFSDFFRIPFEIQKQILSFWRESKSENTNKKQLFSQYSSETYSDTWEFQLFYSIKNLNIKNHCELIEYPKHCEDSRKLCICKNLQFIWILLETYCIHLSVMDFFKILFSQYFSKFTIWNFDFKQACESKYIGASRENGFSSRFHLLLVMRWRDHHQSQRCVTRLKMHPSTVQCCAMTHIFHELF